MDNYLNLLKDVLETGDSKSDRTGTGTISKFGAQLRFDLSKGFPLITTKKLHVKSIIHELLWFLSGDTNSKTLESKGVNIWKEWANENGELGRIYGAQWTDWKKQDGSSINQIEELISQIKTNPESRRLIVTAWNPAELDKMALAPCHCFMQFYVSNNKLSCQLYQRSADLFLGVPFNIASYSLLTHMIAQVCNLEVGEFVHSFGDLHIYNNHVDQVKLQLTRTPTELPTLKINKDRKNINDFIYEDFEFINYNPQPTIKAPVAV